MEKDSSEIEQLAEALEAEQKRIQGNAGQQQKLEKDSQAIQQQLKKLKASFDQFI